MWIELARPALADLDDIWDYLAERDAEHASRFIRGLRERMDVLARFPEVGRAREDLGVGLRALVFEGYAVYYSIQPDAIFVMRVLHGRRDVRPDMFE